MLGLSEEEIEAQNAEIARQDEQERAYREYLNQTNPYALERLLSFIRGERPMRGTMEEYIAARKAGMLPGGLPPGMAQASPSPFTALQGQIGKASIEPPDLGSLLGRARGMLDQVLPMYRHRATPRSGY